MDIKCALIVGGVAIFLTALGYGYKIHADRRHVKLEKQDKEQHKESCQRIEKLEEKNGKELKEIEELKERNRILNERMDNLIKIIESQSKNKQKYK